MKRYIQRVLLPSPSPVLTNIHSIHAYDVTRSEDVGLPTKFWFNVGSASQPIASSRKVNRLRRRPDTNQSLRPLYTLCKDVAFTQCFFNVDSHRPVLIIHCVFLCQHRPTCEANQGCNCNQHSTCDYCVPGRALNGFWCDSDNENFSGNFIKIS